jgi:hypothetical protein
MELLGKQHGKQSNRRDGKKELEADMGGGEDLKVEFVARNMSFDEIVCDPTDRIHGNNQLLGLLHEGSILQHTPRE